MALTVHKPEAGLAQPVAWGVVLGVVNVLAPLAFWWLDLATVHALTISVIAAVYVGFAVADGRPKVIAAETAVTFSFMVVAALAVTGSAWLLVAAYFGHGLKDVWQHRTQFVTGTRWWPPFCAAVDWVVAGSLALLQLAGFNFH